MGTKVKGNLIVIGGNEDKEKRCIILRKFLELANGGKIIIMTTATEEPGKVGDKYIKIFSRLGCDDVEMLDIPDRVSANDPGNVGQLDQASGIFFTGGDQLKITGTLGGTVVDRRLHELYERGVVIAGTSAGASVMSSTMIVGGSNDETPRKDALNMAPGMALIEEVVIDQHFAQRGRIGRLLTVIAQNPHNLGIGIDEDTAIIINNSQCFSVIGSQTVTVVDGETISFTNVSETTSTYPLALADVKLHVLPPGLGFDLKNRRPVLNTCARNNASVNSAE